MRLVHRDVATVDQSLTRAVDVAGHPTQRPSKLCDAIELRLHDQEFEEGEALGQGSVRHSNIQNVIPVSIFSGPNIGLSIQLYDEMTIWTKVALGRCLHGMLLSRHH